MKFRHPAHPDGMVPSLFAQVCHDPVTLTTVAAVASIGGSVLGGLGAMQAGKAANVNAKFQAAQLEQQAGQERASSQRVALEERRRAKITASNAQAAAAASGGSATDPTVLNITGDIAKQGEYNALSALFEGEEKARGLGLQASSTRMEGKQAKRAGMISGISTIVGGVGGSLMSKYAPTGASTASSAPMGYGPYQSRMPGQ